MRCVIRALEHRPTLGCTRQRLSSRWTLPRDRQAFRASLISAHCEMGGRLPALSRGTLQTDYPKDGHGETAIRGSGFNGFMLRSPQDPSCPSGLMLPARAGLRLDPRPLRPMKQASSGSIQMTERLQ
jgi:hypothetical protein